MIILILKTFGVLILAWLIQKLYNLAWWYKQYQFYKGQGVPYLSGFNLLADVTKISEMIEQFPTSMALGDIYHPKFGPTLPPVAGMMIFGETTLWFNSVKVLQDIYVNKNAHYTTTKHFRDTKYPLFGNALIMTPTEHPKFKDKRKTLASAFFKSKLISMTRIIKDVTLQEVRRLQ